MPVWELPLKGDEPTPIPDGPLDEDCCGRGGKLLVIGNRSTALGTGLRSTGPEAPAVIVLSGRLEPGLINVGGGLAQGILDPEESRTSHLEFGSLGVMKFVWLFGMPGEKGPGWAPGMSGEIGPAGLNGRLGAACPGLTERTSVGLTAP